MGGSKDLGYIFIQGLWVEGKVFGEFTSEQRGVWQEAAILIVGTSF